MWRFIILQKEKKNGVLSLQRFMDQKTAFLNLLTGKNTSPKNFKCKFFFGSVIELNLHVLCFTFFV